ncbi:UDP-glucose 4-epimerase GalE, partial [Escherichia coli]|nr:UDP-glucose 4-epimerase GalE [Escherichia coli]
MIIFVNNYIIITLSNLKFERVLMAILITGGAGYIGSHTAVA